MSFTVDRVDHVEVFVRDIEAAVRWYDEVLGLKVIHRFEPPHPVMIGAGGTMLALFQAKPGGQDWERLSTGNPVDWLRVAWHTDKPGFDAAQAHLKQQGVTYDGPIDHNISKSIYFADPDGHPLEITYYVD